MTGPRPAEPLLAEPRCVCVYYLFCRACPRPLRPVLRCVQYMYLFFLVFLFCLSFLLTRPHAYLPHLTHPPAAELLLSPLPAAVSRNAHHLFLPLLFLMLLCHRDSLLYLDRSTLPLAALLQPTSRLLSCYPAAEPSTSTSTYTPQFLLLMSHGHPQPSLMGYGMPMGMGPDFFSQVRLFESLAEHPGALTP